jgi:phosphopantetheinyl transferase
MNEIDNDSWLPISNPSEIKWDTEKFVDLFYISIDQHKALLSYEYVLSAVELAYCNRFIKKNDQQVKKVGKIVTRLLLSHYTHIAPESLCIDRTQYGKPYCVQMPTVRFNASDAGDTILLVISPEEVGVDMELHNQSFIYTDIVADYFTATEIAHVNNSINPLKAFYSIWVKKESILKAIGTGFGALDIDERSWDTRIYQHNDYSIGITTSSSNYPLRFFKYLAVKS